MNTLAPLVATVSSSRDEVGTHSHGFLDADSNKAAFLGVNWLRTSGPHFNMVFGVKNLRLGPAQAEGVPAAALSVLLASMIFKSTSPKGVNFTSLKLERHRETSFLSFERRCRQSCTLTEYFLDT
jgi:hypothetical protein